MELPAHKASISCATAADRLTTLLLGTVRPDGPGPLTLDDQKLAAFGSEVASRLPFRGVGVNVLDAGLLTPPLLQKNRSRWLPYHMGSSAKSSKSNETLC